MSYDEHLITLAGGDGDELDQIQGRVAGAYPGHWYAEVSGSHRADVLATHEDGAVVICEHAGDEADFIANAPADIRHLLALAREQQATIDRVLSLANSAGRCGWKLSADQVRKALKP